MAYQDEVLADLPAYYFPFNNDFNNIGNVGIFSQNRSGWEFGDGVVPPAVGAVIPLGGYFYASPNTDYNANHTWSYETWFKTDYTASSYIFYRTNGSSRIYTSLSASGQLGYYFYTSSNYGAQGSIDVGYPLNDNQWHHLVVTAYKPDTSIAYNAIKIYVDAVEVGSVAYGLGNISLGTARQYIGGMGTGSTMAYQGSLDEFATYGYQLSPERVAAHYNAMLGGGPPTAPLFRGWGIPAR